MHSDGDVVAKATAGSVTHVTGTELLKQNTILTNDIGLSLDMGKCKKIII